MPSISRTKTWLSKDLDMGRMVFSKLRPTSELTAPPSPHAHTGSLLGRPSLLSHLSAGDSGQAGVIFPWTSLLVVLRWFQHTCHLLRLSEPPVFPQRVPASRQSHGVTTVTGTKPPCSELPVGLLRGQLTAEPRSQHLHAPSTQPLQEWVLFYRRGHWGSEQLSNVFESHSSKC